MVDRYNRFFLHMTPGRRRCRGVDIHCTCVSMEHLVFEVSRGGVAWTRWNSIPLLLEHLLPVFCRCSRGNKAAYGSLHAVLVTQADCCIIVNVNSALGESHSLLLCAATAGLRKLVSVRYTEQLARSLATQLACHSRACSPPFHLLCLMDLSVY